MRNLTQKDLAYESINEEWSAFIDNYDTERRIEVLIDDFLCGKIGSKSCLDAGCGLGFFTHALWKQQPLSVTSVDISETLVSRLRQANPATRTMTADLLVLDETLPEQFDVVVSSEVIEHTPDPRMAVAQLTKCVAPGGYLSLSCPNARWHWLLTLAQFASVRKKYQGYENWVRPADLIRWIEQSGLVVVKRRGIHLLPWQLVPKKLMRWLDEITRESSYGLSINLAVLAKKPLPEESLGSA
ncbi:MAG TPA: methyltransferase domain-containing protein [Chthoniobacterales bacterium]